MDSPPNCPKCGSPGRRNGKTKAGTQRYRCPTCGNIPVGNTVGRPKKYNTLEEALNAKREQWRKWKRKQNARKNS